MALISIGTLTDLEKVSYVKEGLEVAKPNLVYQQYGMGDRVEKRDGKTRQWFRFTKSAITSGSDFSGAATYVKNTTGAPPTFTPATPSDTLITAQVDFLFGKGHEWNEGVQYTSFADLPKELRVINAQHASEATDTEVRDVLKAGTNVAYANAKASRGLLTGADQIDIDDLTNQLVTMRDNSAKPVKGFFPVFCSNSVIGQLLKDSAFRTAVQLQREYMFTGTIVEFMGMRFHNTELAPTVTSSGSNNAVANVEQTILVGQNSYGVTKWMLNDYDVVYTPPGGWGDEWAVRHSLTWKHAFKAVILNQSWLLRLESAR